MRRLFIFLMMLGLLVWGGVFFLSSTPSLNQAKTIVLPRHTGLLEIGERLEKAEIVSSSYLFLFITILTNNHHKLKAGEYLIPAGASLTEIITQMAEGRVIKHLFTIPEGFMVSQVVTALNEIPILEGEIQEIPPEGHLMPATYEYVHGDRRDVLLKKMQQKMEILLEKLWQNRPTDCLLKTAQEALILASIVEKETALPHERPRIAGVFLNRLRVKMPLQSDPTVIYGLGKGKPLERLLTYDDLRQATLYNTYVISALPPTPIACPGSEAIKAVLHPEKTNELYFVADGKGGHDFSEGFEAHTEKVRHWRRSQKKKASAPPLSTMSPSVSLGVSPSSNGS